MNKILTALFASALLLSPTLQAQMPAAAPAIIKAEKQDETAIRQLLKDYAAALKSASPKAVAALYTQDGVVISPKAPIAAGKDAVLVNYQHIFDAIGLDLTFDVKEITVSGNYAIVRSTSKGLVTVNANKAQMQDDFRELFVMEKVGGEWKIARYMFNQDH